MHIKAIFPRSKLTQATCTAVTALRSLCTEGHSAFLYKTQQQRTSCICTDLSIDDGSHPESLSGPRNRKHSPEEYEDGEEESEQRSRHHVV